MSRTARSKGQYSHVIVRGIGKQILFEDDFDRQKFLNLLKKYRDELNITIMAYCLMENHVHMLIDDNSGQLPCFMKKLGISYAGYYNRKYERTGHLFQDRYKSEVICDEKGLLNVYRYILKNPEKAHIAKSCKYKWSSFSEYGQKNSLTNTDLFEKIIGDKEKLNDFLAIDSEGEYMEDLTRRHDDEWALNIIRNKLNLSSGTAILQMPKKERDEKLVMLKKQGLSVRQIERLTGVNRNVIQRAK